MNVTLHFVAKWLDLAWPGGVAHFKKRALSLCQLSLHNRFHSRISLAHFSRWTAHKFQHTKKIMVRSGRIFPRPSVARALGRANRKDQSHTKERKSNFYFFDWIDVIVSSLTDCIAVFPFHCIVIITRIGYPFLVFACRDSEGKKEQWNFSHRKVLR